MAFIPKSDLVAGKWYAYNFNPPKGNVIGIGSSAGRSSWDCVVGGPFASEAEAKAWIKQHPDQMFADVLLRRE